MNLEIDGDEDLDVLLLQIMGGDANADLGGHFPTSMQSTEKTQRLNMEVMQLRGRLLSFVKSEVFDQAILI